MDRVWESDNFALIYTAHWDGDWGLGAFCAQPCDPAVELDRGDRGCSLITHRHQSIDLMFSRARFLLGTEASTAIGTSASRPNWKDQQFFIFETTGRAEWRFRRTPAVPTPRILLTRRHPPPFRCGHNAVFNHSFKRRGGIERKPCGLLKQGSGHLGP